MTLNSRLLKFGILSTAIALHLSSCSKNDSGQNNSTGGGQNIPTITKFTPDSGAAGSTVVITGTNFSVNPSLDIVSFNSVQATVETATTTELKVFVPTGATTGKITLTISGNSVTTGNDFVVLQSPWTKKRDCDCGSRGFASGFATGDKVYIMHGFVDPVGVASNDLWMYDPAVNTWSKRANFPGTPRESAIAFSIGAIGYTGAGFIHGSPVPSTEENDLWSYDPSADKWTQKADLPAATREAAIAFTIGNKAYVGLGSHNDLSVALNDFWEYDPTTDSWTRKADFPGSGTMGCAAFAAGGKGYVALGGNVSGVLSKEVWQYDPGTNAWTRKNDFPGDARGGVVGTSIDDTGFLGFGSYPGVILSDFWKYDNVADQWILQSQFPAGARAVPVLVSDGKKGYLGTGYDSTSTPVRDFWEFNP